MSKEPGVTEQHVEGLDGDDKQAAVVATSALAARFEERQHSLSRVEAIKENIRPLAWCMYSIS